MHDYTSLAPHILYNPVRLGNCPHSLTRSIYLTKYDIRRDFTISHNILKKEYYEYRTRLAYNYTR